MGKEEKDVKLEEILEKLEIANNELNKSDIELDKSIEIYTEAMKLVSKGNRRIMQTLNGVLNNKVLIIPFLVLMITQVCKTIYFSIKNKKLDLFTLLTTGGLPSSHSALVASLATVIFKTNGVRSTEFAISVILAIIVMYDASRNKKSGR